MENDSPKGVLIKDTVEVGAVHSNLTQEVIKITYDKLKLILTQYINNVERRKEWLTPLSLLVTFLIVFSTTNFKDSLSIKSDTWEAFFLMASFLTFVWLIFTVVRAVKTKSLEDIIKLIKSDNN